MCVKCQSQKRVSETGVTGNYSPPSRCWESNLVLLQEEPHKAISLAFELAALEEGLSSIPSAHTQPPGNAISGGTDLSVSLRGHLHSGAHNHTKAHPHIHMILK